MVAAAALGDLRRIRGNRKKGERRRDQRPADYVLLTRNKSSWTGGLEDRLESMSDKSVRTWRPLDPPRMSKSDAVET